MFVIKTFAVTAELFWNAANNKTVIVKANTERKARIMAENKLKKDYGTDMIRILSVRTV